MTELAQRIKGMSGLASVIERSTRSSERPREQSGAAMSERRQSPRHALNQPLLVIPVLPDGSPDTEHRRVAMARDVSSGGLGLEFAADDWNPGLELMVGLGMADGLQHFAGVEVRRVVPPVDGHIGVGSQIGGVGQALLQSDNLTPAFHWDTMKFTHGFPEEVLRKWADVGILQQDSLDRVQLCPRCQGLSTFRPGCRVCGSADVGNEQLIHHFACAHVGPVGEFETPAGLVCPKCRTHSLVIGADFEYLTGPYVCRKCKSSDMELEQVARCLRCGFSFPAHQAYLQELRGYSAQRLDPLAALPGA